MDVVVLVPEQSKYGAVETYDEAKRCAELFKSKADTIDDVIVTLPNFGDERAIAGTLRLSRLEVPVLVQATPDCQVKWRSRIAATASAVKCPLATICANTGFRIR
jgi:L-fucose isomerase-like protein